MGISRLEYLFECYVSLKCSLEEEKELMRLLNQPENEVFVQTLIDRIIKNTGSEMEVPPEVAASILENILRKNQQKPFFPWIKVAAAAILFVIGTTTYWILQKNYIKTDTVKSSEKNLLIAPGGNHATLTMSDGSTLVLDSIQNGKIQYGGTKINKQNGLLVFNGISHHPAIASFNTLTTPRGGQYKLILSDGSKVWLNASSSLRFPTSFTGNQREVELIGEAYFEVAKNKAKPFHVKVGNMQVNVLGTRFNINAYSDESSIKTSLLEGSVKITTEKEYSFLKPGQQGVINKNKDKVEIRYVNMDEVIAWKNGLFQFEGADITTIMKQIGRWYDVDIEYAGTVPSRLFEGKISRDAQLSDVLKILELSNVKFVVEGKKIIVQ
jgi:ferric-dicitrate binding protein FerR (iron transport regulator)